MIFQYLGLPTEIMYWFLYALSNVFLSLRSLRGRPGEHNVLIFACFEQCFPIFEVTPRTAGSAECIDFYMLWTMFTYLWGHSEDCRECRMHWFLHTLSNVFLPLRSLWRPPGVQNVLIFTCFEQCLPIFEVTPKNDKKWIWAGTLAINTEHRCPGYEPQLK